MARPLILDGRNLYDPERLRRLGFEYHSIGRAAATKVAGKAAPNGVSASKVATNSTVKETVAA